ncbi:MAG: hypothetical protein V1872_00210 [bacterium]
MKAFLYSFGNTIDSFKILKFHPEKGFIYTPRDVIIGKAHVNLPEHLVDKIESAISKLPQKNIIDFRIGTSSGERGTYLGHINTAYFRYEDGSLKFNFFVEKSLIKELENFYNEKFLIKKFKNLVTAFLEVIIYCDSLNSRGTPPSSFL